MSTRRALLLPLLAALSCDAGDATAPTSSPATAATTRHCTAAFDADPRQITVDYTLTTMASGAAMASAELRRPGRAALTGTAAAAAVRLDDAGGEYFVVDVEGPDLRVAHHRAVTPLVSWLEAAAAASCK